MNWNVIHGCCYASRIYSTVTKTVAFLFQDLPLKKGDIIVISNKTKVSSVEKNFDWSWEKVKKIT